MECGRGRGEKKNFDIIMLGLSSSSRDVKGGGKARLRRGDTHECKEAYEDFDAYVSENDIKDVDKDVEYHKIKAYHKRIVDQTNAYIEEVREKLRVKNGPMGCFAYTIEKECGQDKICKWSTKGFCRPSEFSKYNDWLGGRAKISELLQ